MSAIISPCGKFRFRLERDVSLYGKTYAFFGINPSTADATINDATVRKWIGFVTRWGGWRFIVGNVSPARSTDVKGLATILVSNDVWQQNIDHIKAIAAEADILVPCWGDQKKAPRHLADDFATVLRVLRATGKPVMTFGLTKDGHPKHPLMLGYDTELRPMTNSEGVRE